VTRFATQSNADFESIIYDHSDLEHRLLLEQYFKHSDAPNNISHNRLKTEQYDGNNGILFLLLNVNTYAIDGMSSCLRVGDTAKVFHRLHMKPNVPHSAIDRFIEYETYDWCWTNGLEKLWFTVNEEHTDTLFWVSKRVGQRRNANRPNKYKDQKYNFIRAGWRPHNKLIYEKETWQYVIYYSTDGEFFLNRDEKDMGSDAYNMFIKEYPNATQDW
jgi:hypothetical protein